MLSTLRALLAHQILKVALCGRPVYYYLYFTSEETEAYGR